MSGNVCLGLKGGTYREQDSEACLECFNSWEMLQGYTEHQSAPTGVPNRKLDQGRRWQKVYTEPIGHS